MFYDMINQCFSNLKKNIFQLLQYIFRLKETRPFKSNFWSQISAICWEKL